MLLTKDKKHTKTSQRQKSLWSAGFFFLVPVNTHSNTHPYMCLDEHPRSAK